MPISATDVLVTAGIILVGIGAWLIYPPAALIMVGVILLSIGLVAAHRGR